MKKFRQFAVATLMILAMCSLIAVFAACDKITEIKVAEGNLPKTTFILGQELDLSGGKLTVVNNGKEEEVALDSSEVTVSGYDKDKEGEQELTIAYKDFTTTVKINVVPRMVVTGYASKYFVGEQFSKTSGSVRINLDTGKYINKPISDEEISVVSFDSSKAGSTTVTLRYRSGEVEYSAAVPVQILEVASKDLKQPNNRYYKSHQSEIDLAGATITLKSAGTGSDVLTRRISVTADMLSEYDLSAATIDNIENPLTQNVKVTYGGQEIGSFDIFITYSAVSLMQDKAEELKELDFTSGIPAITPEQGDAAMSAMQHYFTLNADEKELVSAEDKAIVVRVASAYCKGLWDEETGAFSRTFEVEVSDIEGQRFEELKMKSTNFEHSKLDYAKLEKPDAVIKKYGKLLINIKNEFSALVLTGDKKVGDYLYAVYETEYFDTVLKNLDFMYDLFKVLSVDKLPVDWTEENIVNYRDVINESINFFMDEKLYNKDLYDCVSAWRGDAEDKYIPEMYLTYCWKADDRDGINKVATIYVPDDFMTLYLSIEAALSELDALKNSDIISGNINMDTSMFMLYYYHINATMEEVRNKGVMMAWLLDNLEPYVGFNYEESVNSLLRDKGYNALQGAMLGDKTNDAMWKMFIDVMDDALLNDEYNMDKIEEMLLFLLDMPDSNKFVFITSVNTWYLTFGIPTYALDYNSGMTTMSKFATFLGVYGNGVTDDEDGTVLVQPAVPKSVNELLASLLRTIEDCARRSTYSVDLTESFLENMAETVRLYDELTKAAAAGDAAAKTGKDWFDAKYLKYYQQYLAVSELYDEEGNFKEYENLGEEWEAKFREVREVAYDIMIKNYLINQNKGDDFVVLFAQYELLEKLSLEILSSGNDTVIKAYYNKLYDFKDFGKYTLEYAVMLSRDAYRTWLVLLGGWDMYRESGLKEFMIMAVPVMNMGYDTLDDEGNAIEIVFTEKDAENVKAVLEAYRELSIEDRMLFVSLNLSENNDYYYGAMLYYFSKTILTDNAENKNCTAFIEDLFLLEQGTTLCLYAKDYESENFATMLETYEKLYNDAKASFKALGEADKALLPDYITKMYDSYCKMYEQIMQNN